jgi:tetratricopeptide (TPR) repeat protein
MEDARARYMEALARREQQGPSRELEVLLHNIGDAAWRLGDVREALRWQERGLAIAEQIGDPSLVGFALAWVGHYHTILGDYAQAREFCERGVTAVDDLGPSWNSVYPPLFLAVLDELEGKAGADSSLRRVLDTAATSRDQQAMLEALRPLVRLALRQGNPQEARALVHMVIEGTPSQAAALWGHTATAHLAWVLLELGESDEAERTVQESLAAPVLQIAVSDQVTVLRILGTIQGYRDRHDEAWAAFEKSLTLARTLPAPFEEAFTQYHYGSALSQAGHPDDALQRFTAAHTLFQRIGARPYETLVEQALHGRA